LILTNYTNPEDGSDPALFYDAHVFMCTNERATGHPRGCCKDKGSMELRAYMKEKAKALGLSNVRINTAGCLERCELGPAMVIYPEGVWYTFSSKADIDAILEVHLQGQGRVTRLILQPDQTNP